MRKFVFLLSFHWGKSVISFIHHLVNKLNPAVSIFINQLVKYLDSQSDVQPNRQSNIWITAIKMTPEFQ